MKRLLLGALLVLLCACNPLEKCSVLYTPDGGTVLECNK